MVAAESSHSAAAQALGYIHQCMWALVELAQRARVDPATELRLEALDDIQFDQEGTPAELLQMKHHIRQSHALTAQSVDLWRTLNVWMDLPDNDSTILRLVTTQRIDEGSGLACLRGTVHERDVVTAVETLAETAAMSNNSTTKPWRDKFLKMDEGARERFLDRVVIEDSSPRAQDVEQELTRAFRYAYPVGRDAVFANMIKGWWYQICVRLLNGTVPCIEGVDLVYEVNEITDQLRSDSLPIDPSVLEAQSRVVLENYKDRKFVQQLLWIALDEERLWKAIRDYHRSYTQRSFWLRYQLIAETELNRYAFQLRDEWEQVFDTRVAKMRRERDANKEFVGQEILEKIASDSKTRIRDRFNEPWFNRGMLHALADGELGYTIGWHPEFESKLEGLLSDVSA